jgi:hypothetical protein
MSYSMSRFRSRRPNLTDLICQVIEQAKKADFTNKKRLFLHQKPTATFEKKTNTL